MRALQLINGLGLDHLGVVELPDPEPGPHDVLVRMRAVSLNYRDLLMLEGVYGRATTLPLTPFSDGCGVVEAIGSAVTRFQVGDRVSTLFFQKWISGKPTYESQMSALGMPIPGAGRELATFHEDGVSKVPDFLTDNQVSTLACAALTAWRALFEDARLQPGDWVVLQGTGGVSIFGLQFAKAAGYRTVITSASDAKLERARALGADQVIGSQSSRPLQLGVGCRGDDGAVAGGLGELQTEDRDAAGPLQHHPVPGLQPRVFEQSPPGGQGGARQRRDLIVGQEVGHFRDAVLMECGQLAADSGDRNAQSRLL